LNTSNHYDVAIIGAGMAGLAEKVESAGIYFPAFLYRELRKSGTKTE
jgi:pyruvate/2-oxoglutarate dehydrogenase complex dihydrolipoamide dehydrogenase (E3) component